MIEIADFQCPYCGDAQPTVRHVLETYPNDVALAFVNFPLSYHAYAQSCAKAFQAAARQGLAWALYDQMFAHQSALTDADLTGYASAIGLDVVQFNADRASQEIEDQVTEQTNLALSLGVNSTPTFLVGGYRIVGAMPLSTFVKTIDKVLAGTVPGVGP
jgi:protein-disulfide isomerase